MQRVWCRFVPSEAVCACLLLALLPLLVETSRAQSLTTEANCQIGASAGARRYCEGKWSVVEFRAMNPTDEAVDVQAELWFLDAPNFRFSRRATALPHSMVRSICPVLVPSSDDRNKSKRSIELHAQQLLPKLADMPLETLSPQELQMRAKPILLDSESPTVGMISDLLFYHPPGYELDYHTDNYVMPPEPDDPIYQLVLAAKRSRGLSRRISAFDPEALPADPTCYSMLDVIVVSGDWIAQDPQGIVLVRDWVMQGGNLWITLDDVRSETVSALLGDDFACTQVDRVEVSELTIEPTSEEGVPNELDHLELDQPVPLVRMLVEGVTVTHTVNGWPAAFWQPYGDGRVYYTTLGPHAWMRLTTAQDPSPANRENDTVFFPRAALDDFAEDCITCSNPMRMQPESLKPFLSQEIGYRIISRSTVLAVLLAFCGLLAAAGLYAHRTGRAERMLSLTAGLAVAFGALFLVAGTATKKAVPSTVVTLARVILEPGAGSGHAYGLLALYNQDASSEPMGATDGGVFVPDLSGMTGTNRRITWTDEGVWHWEELELPSGVRTAPFQQAVTLNGTAECEATFGPEGLRGRVGSLGIDNLQDAIIGIAYQNAIAAQIEPDGVFHAGPDDVLAAGQYIAGALVNDQRRRRKAIYELALQRDPTKEVLERPILYAWSDAHQSGFQFPQQQQTAAALISIPIALRRTPAGTQVRIPSPFVPYRVVVGPGGEQPVAFTNVSRQWIECKFAVTQWLRFQLPETVLPLQVSEAKLTLSIRAPSRHVELLLPRGGDDDEVLLDLAHPLGTYGCTLSDPAQLQLDDRGGLVMALRVGEDQTAPDQRADQISQDEWQVKEIQMEITGTVQADAQGETP